MDTKTRLDIISDLKAKYRNKMFLVTQGFRERISLILRVILDQIAFPFKETSRLNDMAFLCFQITICHRARKVNKRKTLNFERIEVGWLKQMSHTLKQPAMACSKSLKWRDTSPTFKRLLRKLKTKKRRQEELISLYIAQGSNMSKKIKWLQDEKANSASNIKDKTTKKNVVDALAKIIQHLRACYKKTPPKGLALFCGNVSEKNGHRHIRLWTFDDPPKSISIDLYRCLKVFDTETSENMLKPKVVYGVITIDNKKASISLFEGDRFPKPNRALTRKDEGKGNPHVDVKRKMKSAYPGKTRNGGMSTVRYAGRRKETSKGFMKRVAKSARKFFMPEGKLLPNLKGFLVGGPGPIKYRFVNEGYLHPYLAEKVIAVEDIGYADESGIRELILKAEDKLTDLQLVRERKLLQRFLESLARDKPVAYGEAEIVRALNANAVETLLLSEKLDPKEIESYFTRCENTCASIEVFSMSSESGMQLWSQFGGRAALLKHNL